MKSKLISLVLLLVLLSACSSPEKPRYKGSPVINAVSLKTSYRIDNDWFRSRWSIAPQVTHDTLKVICYKPEVSFEFKTDIDSITFELPVNSSKSFYVRLDENTYAHTIIQGIAFQPNQLKHDTTNTSEISVKYQTEPSVYLAALKQQFPLDFIKDKMSDMEVILAVLDWTSSRWEHNGNNSPSKSDAITILNEVEEGQEFPCFAYAIVLRDQLNALGYKARTIYLKTKDATHRKRSPGHVATEVFLNDLQKWVFVDGQFNIMPTLKGLPLNAVEFQNAINNHYEDFDLESLSTEKPSKATYVNFVYDYLYYFDTTLENRYEKEKRHQINGKRSMMLVPVGAKNLTHIDYWNTDVNYCIYTNSLKDFYAIP